MDRQQIVSRVKPYGLGIVPDREQFEYIDPRNEPATEARWRPVLERLGIRILGIRDVPSQPLRIEVDSVDWELRPMGNETYNVPESVYHCIRATEAEGVPFAYWLWGEEQFTRPKFQPVREPTPVRSAPRQRDRDPIVIGVIPTAPNRGIWCLLGKWFH